MFAESLSEMYHSLQTNSRRTVFMAKVVQLDFFEETEISSLKADFQEVKDSCDRVRKKQFGEIGKLTKLINDLTARLEIIERHICNSKLNF